VRSGGKKLDPNDYYRETKTLTFNPFLLERALKQAKKERRSMSMLTEIALTEYLDRVEKKKGV